jgi:hypothetical protein
LQQRDVLIRGKRRAATQGYSNAAVVCTSTEPGEGEARGDSKYQGTIGARILRQSDAKAVHMMLFEPLAAAKRLGVVTGAF